MNLAQAQVNDIVQFGYYIQNDQNDTKDPINWIVLDKKDNKILLLSQHCLVPLPFNRQRAATTWVTCTLRKWLNEDFYKTAFSDEEKERIFASIQKNEKSKNSFLSRKVIKDDDTHDKIFILDIEETNKYLPSNQSRQTTATPYALSKGAYANGKNGFSWWWLRSPGYYALDGVVISDEGEIQSDGQLVSCDYYTVRPAIWVNL